MTKAERLQTYGLTQNDWLDSPTVPYREEDQYERCIDDKQCKLHPPIYSASWQLTYSQIDIETGRDRVIGDTNIDQDYTSSFSVDNSLCKTSPSAMETSRDGDRRGGVLNTTETVVNPMDIPNNSSPLLLQNELTPLDIMMGFIPGSTETPGDDDKGATKSQQSVSKYFLKRFSYFDT